MLGRRSLDAGWFTLENVSVAESPATRVYTVVSAPNPLNFTHGMSPSHTACGLCSRIGHSAAAIVEAALCLLKPDTLPPLARRGGVLTPMTAFGDFLVERLEERAGLKIESEIMDADDDIEEKKGK